MEIRSLECGVEIAGFAVHDERDPAAIARLRQAYDEHGLLVFREAGRVTPERQVEMSGWFGPVISNDNSGKQWTVLSNAQTAGSIALPFHCDVSYTDHPLLGLSLHALEIPCGTTPTSFVSNVDAWSDLPAAQQRAAEHLTLQHFFSGHLYEGWPDFEAFHPLCLAHPRTGRPLLFATAQHASRIVELDETASVALIAELFAHLYRPERRYDHEWREGDLLFWDNIAMQHARIRPSEPTEGPRRLQRVALGEVSTTDLFEIAKDRHARMGTSL